MKLVKYIGHMPGMAGRVQTAAINIITALVASGLILNGRRNREIPVCEWSDDVRAPRVQIIAPVRDEERNVAGLLDTLLAQKYPQHRWGITLVDDGSTDGTRAAAEQLCATHPELTVVSAPPLPSGWTGKSHAMYTGYMASPDDAEWLLFVDADTRHHPLTLSSVVRAANSQRADLLSLVIQVETRSFWERVLVPQVGEMYTLLVGTMDQVNEDGGGGAAAANGQFMLVKRDIFGALSPSREVRGDVAEDRALALAMKSRGYRVRLQYGRKLVSARVYSSLGEMWSGYSKTLFWASGRNTRRALGVALALSFYALLPPVLLAARLLAKPSSRKAALRHFAMQTLPMLVVRVEVCHRMAIPARYALCYPAGVAVGNAMLLYSLYRVRSRKGVRWKGRTYG